MLKTTLSCFDDFAHIFFPHVCEGCGSDIVNNDSVLCAECFSSLPGTGFIKEAGNPVEKIFHGRLNVQAAASAYYFTKHSLLQRLILQLKYFNNKEIGFYLGKLLGYQAATVERFNDADVIIPLPLNARKERKRGYNQAAVIAEGLTSIWTKPVLHDTAHRVRFTETQTRKDRIARWQTMEGAFTTSNNELLKDKHVLLIDDIITTGATLEACGEQILKIPGTKLSILTIAYTI
jgi:ComF family protein